MSLIGARHGLTSDVTSTSTLVGRYYGNSRTRTALYQNARATSDWDILTWLAEIEGYDLWVDGYTLHFHPRSDAAPVMAICANDCIDLHLHRRLDIAAGVSITVKSWDCRTQQAVTQARDSGSGSPSAMKLVIVRPNLPTADAALMAQQALNQMTRHERIISFSMPGDLITLPRMMLALAHTGTDFDGTYEVSEVERSFSVRRGFVQHVQARSVAWTQ
ncbi:MAG: hypothetical protein WDN04_16770 [Rhodospirillales bacterium]